MEQMNGEQIAAYLKSKKIRPSVIRIKVLKYLNENRVHPTADKIYKELYKEIPTLSKTSIYNTLKSFAKSGIISELTIEDGMARYDADVEKHGHFRCRKCGKIEDFKTKCDFCYKEPLSGYIIETEHMYVTGLCAVCAKKEKK